MTSDEKPPVDNAPDPDGEPTRVLPAVPRAPQNMPDAVAPVGAAAPAPAGAPARSRAGRFALWLAIILMLLLIVSIIAALLSRTVAAPEESASPSASPSVTASASPSPSPSASPTPSPSPTPTETEEPPSGPQFVLFSVPGEAMCLDESDTVDITVEWDSTGAENAWVGIATTNAKDEPFSDVPTSGSVVLPFPCSNESQVYTVTLEDSDGNLEHESATVERVLG